MMLRTPMRLADVLLLLGMFAGCRSAPQATAQPSSSMAASSNPRSGGSREPAPTTSAPALAASSSRPASVLRPQSKQACDACAGNWAVHGIAETPSCICKTRDGGRVCRDGSDCEGQCLVADDAKFEVVSPGPPPRGYYVGRCSEFDTTFGCNRMIPRGARARGPVPKPEALDELCVD